MTDLKLVKILSESKDTYSNKCVSRIFGLMCLHQSCISEVMNNPRVPQALVNILCEVGLDESFLYEHLKTIRLLGIDMMHWGVTCELSALLKRPLSQKLENEIFQLIKYFFNKMWFANSIAYDKGKLTLQVLVDVVNAKGKLSKRVNKFILHQLLPITEVYIYLRSSELEVLLVDNFKGSKCYKEKQKLLYFMQYIVSNESNAFKSNGGFEMLMECLNDPLFRPSFRPILNIFRRFIESYLESMNLNLVFLISFCFNILEQDNLFNLSEITSILLDNEEEEILRDGEDKNPHDNLVENNSKKSDVTDTKVLVERININLRDYLEKLSIEDDMPKEERHSSKLSRMALSLLSEVALKEALHEHFNSSQRIRNLINAIATSPGDIYIIFNQLSDNPLFFQVFISEMVLPMMDLFNKVYQGDEDMEDLVSNLKDFMNDITLDIHKFICPKQSEIKFILSLCHFIESHWPSNDISECRNRYFGSGELMTNLVSCMYDHQHPLRLLAITSYCRLLSSVEDSCECEVDEFNIKEKKKVAEREYDVNFVVGEECVRSVKSRLMQHSDMFTAMFNGVYSEASSAHVVVTDTSPEAFRVFNDSLLSGRFNCEFYNCDLMLQVLQLANKYLVRSLERHIVRMICSNLSAYLDAILTSNFFIASRLLLVSCLLHVCRHISDPYPNDSLDRSYITKPFKVFTNIFKVFTQKELTDISTKFFKSLCIHQV